MIEIFDDHKGDEQFDVPQMASVCPEHFPAAERIPGRDGTGCDWYTWYKAWSAQASGESFLLPSHLQVLTPDGFQATIPWPLLNNAMVLFEKTPGELMESIELVVPDAPDERLNVSGITQIHLLYDPARGMEPTFEQFDRSTTQHAPASEVLDET